MAEPDFLIKFGDTSSPLASTLEDSNGVPVDILGANIRWKMAPLAGGTVSINAVASNLQSGVGGTSNATTGDVSYSWGTVPGPGRFLGEWEVTYAGGAVQTFPNDGYVLIDVVGDIR